MMPLAQSVCQMACKNHLVFSPFCLHECHQRPLQVCVSEAESNVSAITTRSEALTEQQKLERERLAETEKALKGIEANYEGMKCELLAVVDVAAGSIAARAWQ